MDDNQIEEARKRFCNPKEWVKNLSDDEKVTLKYIYEDYEVIAEDARELADQVFGPNLRIIANCIYIDEMVTAFLDGKLVGDELKEKINRISEESIEDYDGCCRVGDVDSLKRLLIRCNADFNLKWLDVSGIKGGWNAVFLNE